MGFWAADTSLVLGNWGLVLPHVREPTSTPFRAGTPPGSALLGAVLPARGGLVEAVALVEIVAVAGSVVPIEVGVVVVARPVVAFGPESPDPVSLVLSLLTVPPRS